MKQLTSVIWFLLFTAIPAHQVQSAPLSDSAKISVLTCAPGDALYSYFGHCAVRVNDLLQDIDIVFNWGTFDFATPNFYSKFVRGRLNYMLSVSNYTDFKTEYILEKRSIYEQDLVLSPAQEQVLFNNMLVNYQPENRFYLYDFFFDNCATRIRDIIDSSLVGGLTFYDSQYAEEVSFRQLLDPYIGHDGWLDFGIDLALGLPSDKIAQPFDYMFLPDFLMEQLVTATLEDGTLAADVARTLYEAPERSYDKKPWGPDTVFWSLLTFIVLITLWEYWKQKRAHWIDTVIFTLFGLLGWFLVFLWIGTDHKVMEKNLDLLWAIPLYIPVAFFVRSYKRRSWVGRFFTVTFVLHFFTLLLFPLMKDMLSVYILPLVLIVTLRSFLYSYFFQWGGWAEYAKKSTR